MSKQQLTQLLIKGDKPYHRNQIWFQRYNDVIDVYNSSSSKTHTLSKLYCQSRLYRFISYLLNNYLLNIAMVLIFTFMPLFNIVLQILMISYTLFLNKQTKKHKVNIQKVNDPFQNFFYYPEMCQQLQKHFTTLNLTVDQIQSFKFNQSHQKLRFNLLNSQNSIQNIHQTQNSQFTDNQNQNKLVNKEAQNNEANKRINKQKSENKQKKYIKVPIYDQYFYDSFYLVRKQYFKGISWSILGMVLLSLSIFFYSAIYEDLSN